MYNNGRRNKLYTTAVSQYFREKLGMSKDLLNEIIRADPDDKIALLARGSIYPKMDNVGHAIEDFGRVLEIDSQLDKIFTLELMR